MDRLATFFPKFPACGRCHKEVMAQPMRFEAGSWYHEKCYQEGLTDLQRAEEMAQRSGFGEVDHQTVIRSLECVQLPTQDGYLYGFPSWPADHY
jgi:hypothetical protein